MTSHRAVPGRGAGLGGLRGAWPGRPVPGGQPVLPHASASRRASWPAWSAGRRWCRRRCSTRARRCGWRRPSGSPCCPARRRSTRSILDHPERAAHDLSSLRLAVTGAADVPVALVERMRRELSFETVLTAYGLTEAVVATMCRPGDPPEVVSATSGRAAAGFEVRIGRRRDPAPRAEPDARLPRRPGGDGGRDRRRRLAAHRRRRPARRGRVPDHHRPAQGHVHLRRLQRLPGRGGAGAGPARRGGRVGRDRRGRARGSARSARRSWSPGRASRWPRRRCWPSAGSGWPTTRCPGRCEFRDALPRNPSGKVLKRAPEGGGNAT